MSTVDRGQVISDRDDDWIDDYVEYRITTDAGGDSDKQDKKNDKKAGCDGCLTTLVLAVIVPMAVGGLLAAI